MIVFRILESLSSALTESDSRFKTAERVYRNAKGTARVSAMRRYAQELRRVGRLDGLIRELVQEAKELLQDTDDRIQFVDRMLELPVFDKLIPTNEDISNSVRPFIREFQDAVRFGYSGGVVRVPSGGAYDRAMRAAGMALGLVQSARALIYGDI